MTIPPLSLSTKQSSLKYSMVRLALATKNLWTLFSDFPWFHARMVVIFLIEALIKYLFVYSCVLAPNWMRTSLVTQGDVHNPMVEAN